MDKEQITQLVIDELVGDITPEDAALLQKLLQENPAAVIHRENVIKLLTEGDMKGMREEEVSIERSLTKLKKQQLKKKIRFLGSSGAVILLLFLTSLGGFLYKHRQQVKESRKSAVLEAAMYKYPLLLFDDGSFIRLDTINPDKIPNLSSGRQHNTAFIHGPVNQFEKATLITARGENYQLGLSDGSTLYAGPKTSVKLFLSTASRIRELAVSGEAYIKAAHDPRRPFVVHLPQDGKISVLGTAFNINTEKQSGVQVALEEGSVKVENGKGVMLLEPGFAATWRKGSSIDKTKFDEKAVLAWQEGRYVCTQATLRDLAPVLERCFHYPVSIDVPAAKDTSRFIDVELVRGNPIEDFLNSAVVFPSHNQFTFYFDKDSTLHISLNHGPSINHR